MTRMRGNGLGGRQRYQAASNATRISCRAERRKHEFLPVAIHRRASPRVVNGEAILHNDIGIVMPFAPRNAPFGQYSTF